MKKYLHPFIIVSTFITLVFTQKAQAQAPQSMTYQSVLRNSGNTLLSNTTVSSKISILQGTSNGTVVYSEIHRATTNANGLLSFQIGNGILTTSLFSDINWANGPYFIKTETDPTGGNNYTIIGTQQMASVPYALYSEKSGDSVLKENTINKSTDVNLGTSDILFPTQNATKTYIDTRLASIPTGATGPQGETGPRGIQGEIGLQGPQGIPGPIGMQGEPGPQGIPGPIGMHGEQGPQGIQGETGPMGMQGPQGIPGPIGMHGEQGPQGVQGLTGMQGETGPMGIQGAPGPQGIPGPIGLQGETGPIGMLGPKGDKGDPGFISVGAISSFSNSNGVSVNQGELSLAPADLINGGVVTTGEQTFAGNKTFDGRSNFNQGATFNGFVNGQIGMLDWRFWDWSSRLRHDGFMFDLGARIVRIDSDFMDLRGQMRIGGNVDISQNLNVFGNSTSNSFIKQNGLSTEFLKADGSVDTNTYATTSFVDTKENAINKSTDVNLGTSDTLFPTQNATKTYVDALVSSTTPTFSIGTEGSDFNISTLGTAKTFNLPDASALNRGAVTTGEQTFAGNKTFDGRSNFNQGATFNGFVNGQIGMLDWRFWDWSSRLRHDGFMFDLGARIVRIDSDFMDLRGQMRIGGNVDISQNLNVFGNSTSNSFIKQNGLSTEFLKADGSVDTNKYATTSIVDTKENAINKSTDVNLGTSDTLFPTQNATKTYVDALVSSTSPTFSIGTEGSDFNISTLGTAKTFNLPDASALNRGVVTTGEQTFAGNKTFDSDFKVNGQTNLSDLSVNGFSQLSFLRVHGFADIRDAIFTGGWFDVWGDARFGSNILNQGNITSNSFIKQNGLSNEFLKADGSVDTNTYATSAYVDNLISSTTPTFTIGTEGSDFNISTLGTAKTFNLPDASALNRGVVTTGEQTFAGNKTFDSDFKVNGQTNLSDLSVNGFSQLSFLRVHGFADIRDAIFTGGWFDVWGDARFGSNILNQGNITSNSFIKQNGLSNEFLKADGSVDTNTYATTSNVDNLTGQVTLLQTQLTDNQAVIIALQAQIFAMQEQISALQNANVAPNSNNNNNSGQ